MQSLTEKVYRLSPPGGLFNETVVRNLFPAVSEGARKLLVRRAVAKKEIIRIKPGLFLLAPDFRKSHPHPFVIAAALHSPSHVSLESALSFHGLIPEAVFQVSSVTAARSRRFQTPVGLFTFQRVPASNPKAGVVAVKLDAEQWAFAASPLRAIADIVYLRGIGWNDHGLDFLIDSMRIEKEDLKSMSFEGLPVVTSSIRNRRTKEFLTALHREMSQ